MFNPCVASDCFVSLVALIAETVGVDDFFGVGAGVTVGDGVGVSLKVGDGEILAEDRFPTVLEAMIFGEGEGAAFAFEFAVLPKCVAESTGVANAPSGV